MKCPKCKSLDLKKGTVKNSGVEIDYCAHCNGIWFDARELEQVTNAAIKELVIPRDAERTSFRCPRCTEPMHAFNYPQTLVEVDLCCECKGLWVDKGELKEIEAVRRDLAKSGRAWRHDAVPGVKGALLRWIDSAIDSLVDF